MLLWLLDKKYPIDYIVFCDTGVEYPEVYEHIEKVDMLLKQFGKQITVLKGKYDFFGYLMLYKRTKGKYKGLPYGFPTRKFRWCTELLKLAPLRKFKASIKSLNQVEFIDYIGYSTSEIKRALKTKDKETPNQKFVFPLIKARLDKRKTLQLCYSNGFDWNGLYNYINRASCYTCPFQSKKELRYLMTKHPELWNKIKELESNLKKLGVPSWKFKPEHSTEELEKQLLG